MSIADGSAASRPWWIRRWPWILAVVTVAALVWIPLSIRARGRAHYAAARARMAAAGMGGGLEEFKRDAPVVDPNIQARWRSVVLRAGSCALQMKPLRGRISDWMVGGGPEPEGAREAYEADAEIRADAAALLAEGLPVPGVLGNWLASGGGRINPLGGIHCENLLGVKNLANLFLVQAAFEEDPGAALAVLDRMHEAFARPGALIDGMIGTILADTRDETYARLALAGRLPREAGDWWLAEEPVEPRRVAVSLRGERVLFLEPLAEGIATGTISGADFSMDVGIRSSPSKWLEGRGEASAWWLHGSEAFARVLEYYGEGETALREGSALPTAPDVADAAGRLAGVIHTNLPALASTALMARQRHRTARAFVRAVKAPIEGVLPAGGPAELPIVVERMGAARLRLRTDTSGTLPPAWQGIGLPMPPPDPSGPPKPFVWGYGFIEADLPAPPR